MDVLDHLLARLGPLPLLLLGLLVVAAVSAVVALGRTVRPARAPAVPVPVPAGRRIPGALPAQRRPAEQQHRA